MSKVGSSFPSLQLLCLQDADGLSGAIVLKCSDMVSLPRAHDGAFWHAPHAAAAADAVWEMRV